MFIHHDFENVYDLNSIKIMFQVFDLLSFEIWWDVYGEREGDFPKAT